MNFSHDVTLAPVQIIEAIQKKDRLWSNIKEENRLDDPTEIDPAVVATLEKLRKDDSFLTGLREYLSVFTVDGAATTRFSGQDYRDALNLLLSQFDPTLAGRPQSSPAKDAQAKKIAEIIRAQMARSEDRSNPNALESARVAAADVAKVIILNGKEIEVTARKVDGVLQGGMSVQTFAVVLEDAAQQAIDELISRQVGQGATDATTGVSQKSGLVGVDKEMAIRAIRFAVETFKGATANQSKYSNLGIAFDLNGQDVNKAFFAAVDVLKAELLGSTLFLGKETAIAAAPELIKRGFQSPQVVRSFKIFKVSGAVANKVMPTVRTPDDVGSVSDLVVPIDVESKNIKGETYLEQVEKVVQILSGLVIAANAESKDSLNSNDLRDEIYKMLFKQVPDQYKDVMRIENGRVVINRAKMLDFVQKYLAAKVVGKAA